MIRLYFHTSPNPMKVALFLEEAGLAYQIAPIDTRRGDQHAAAFRRLNPNGKTPVIEVDGEVVFDSNAILLWLAERSGEFMGPQKARAELLSWLMFVATGLGPFGGQAFHFRFIAPEVAYARNRYDRELERHFAVLDERLRERTYVVADDYTIVDIAAWGWVRLSGALLGEGVLERQYPSVARWFDRVDSRPAAERARRIGEGLSFKQDMDEEALKALFPQNYATADAAAQ